MPEGSGAGWGPAGRRGKLIPGIHIISHRVELLPLTGWKRLSAINLLSSSWLISEGYDVVSDLSVGLCFSQVGHSLAEGNHAAGHHHVNDGSVIVNTFWFMATCQSFGLFGYSLSQDGCCPVGIIMQCNAMIVTLFVPTLGSSTSSSLHLLFLFLKCFSFQPPDQLVKQFTIAFVYFYLGHFFS